MRDNLIKYEPAKKIAWDGVDLDPVVFDKGSLADRDFSIGFGTAESIGGRCDISSGRSSSMVADFRSSTSGNCSTLMLIPRKRATSPASIPTSFRPCKTTGTF